MEQLNRIELRGRVGNVRLSKVGEDKECCHFSVATNTIYRNQEGTAVEETTWHSCVLWSSRRYPDLSFIKVGAPLELVGRMRSKKFTSSDGTDRYSYDVWVNEVRLIPEGEPLRACSTV